MILIGVSLNQTALDWDGNLERILFSLDFIKEKFSFDNTAKVVLFPELTISGYGCEDGFLMSYTKTKSLENLYLIINHTKQLPNTLVFVGLPFYMRGNLYNTMAAIYSGELLAIVPKSYLAGEGIHYEPRWFVPYKANWKRIQHEIYKKEFGFYFGQGIFEFANIRMVIEICEDSWVVHRPSLRFYGHDLDLILNPSASHFALGKHNIRKNIAITISQYQYSYYLSVNLLGNEAGKAIYDGSILLSLNGKMLYENERFSFSDVVIRSFNLDFREVHNKRDRIYSRRNDRKKTKQIEILKIPLLSQKRPIFEATIQTEETKIKNENFILIDYSHVSQLPLIENQHQNEYQEFLDAERLGLFDYLRKTQNQGFTISLSGGADSSVCAILVYQMVRKAVIEMGIKNFLKKSKLPISLEDFSSLTEEEQIKSLMPKVLHTIYQKTKQNSEQTFLLANELAEEIQSDHFNLDIQNVFEFLMDHLEKTFSIQFDWEKHDLILQNLQSRIRSPIVWTLANLTHSILLTTSNRSEASVGYSTMDGDTSGGLAPIAGVDKPFLLGFLEFISKYTDKYTKPIKTAQKIANQPPSAELRPLEKKQTDEKDLMPYPLLAMIEKLAIEELLSPEEIKTKLLNYKTKKLPQIQYSLPYFEKFLIVLENISESQLDNYINTFFRLWQQSQWKRERFAISFHIDSYNVDPRGWFRYPVISKAPKIKKNN